MFGFAIVLAALSFVGAPGGIPVTCHPELPSGIQGRTYWDAGIPDEIDLGAQTCAGLLLLAVSPSELNEIVALNGPSLNVAADQGIGAETLLVETIHATHGFNGTDETDDACRAMALLPSFLAKYLNGDALAAALRWAGIFYASQPASIYRTHPC